MSCRDLQKLRRANHLCVICGEPLHLGYDYLTCAACLAEGRRRVHETLDRQKAQRGDNKLRTQVRRFKERKFQLAVKLAMGQLVRDGE